MAMTSTAFLSTDLDIEPSNAGTLKQLLFFISFSETSSKPQETQTYTKGNEELSASCEALEVETAFLKGSL